MPDSQSSPRLSTISVEFTPIEAKALRLASIFGTPNPTPPEIESALAKLRAAEKGASGAS